MNLLSLNLTELTDVLKEYNQPPFRAKQLYTQLQRGTPLTDITNIPNALKEALSGQFDCNPLTIERKLVSKLDGTVKYLFGLSDGNAVESVVMHYEHGDTICISSQVGCRMGCRFCASTIGGKVRDLETGELLLQVLTAQRDLGIRIDGIVLMGIGEPLDNYDNVVKFLKTVSDENGLNIGQRHISLSTCGIVPNIRRLAEENLQITLSISLHAPTDETRNEIMPINRRYGVEELLGACKEYFAKTGRRISFEYTLIAEKNDTPEQAIQLAEVLNRHLRTKTDTMPIHVNLIPVNEVKETGFRHGNRDSVLKFADVLNHHGIRATIRRTLGSDINASCGQLRKASLAEKT